MRDSLEELDGVFTYICVTEDALGVAKDELGAKPLVLYEDDELVALASEEIAIRQVLDREIETHDPYEGEVRGLDQVSWAETPSRKMDERGLVELDDSIPKQAKIDGDSAVIEAAEMTTRKINAELRWLIYEQGIKNVTVKDPSARHSLGTAILARCQIRFEGSLGYFGVGLIDGPEVVITGRVGWSVAENMMSGVVVVENNAGSLAGAALRGGDLVVKGDVGARTGIDQKGGTIIALGNAASMTGFMMQRGRQIICGDVGPGLGDSMYDGTIYVGGKIASLGIDCVRGGVDRRRHRAGRAQVRQLRPRQAARAAQVRLREEALQLRQPRAERAKARAVGRRSGWPKKRPKKTAPEQARRPRGPRPQPDLHAGGHQRHPHEVRARPLPDARLLDVQEDPALGRADLPAGDPDPVRDRGLPREVRDEDGAGRPLRQEADRARHPRLHHRDELRRPLAGGEDGAGQGRLDGRHARPARERAG